MATLRRVRVFGPVARMKLTQTLSHYVKLVKEQFECLADAASRCAPLRSSLDQVLSDVTSAGITYGAGDEFAKQGGEKAMHRLPKKKKIARDARARTKEIINGKFRMHWVGFARDVLRDLLVYGMTLCVVTSTGEPRTVPLYECEVYYRRDPYSFDIDYVVILKGETAGLFQTGEAIYHSGEPESDITFVLFERNQPIGPYLDSSLGGIPQADRAFNAALSATMVAVEYNALPTVLASVQPSAADAAAVQRADGLAMGDSVHAQMAARAREFRFAASQLGSAFAEAKTAHDREVEKQEMERMVELNAHTDPQTGLRSVATGSIGRRHQFPLLALPPGSEVANNAAMRPSEPQCLQFVTEYLLGRIAQALGVPVQVLVAASHVIREHATDTMMTFYYKRINSLRTELLSVLRSIMVVCFGRNGERLFEVYAAEKKIRISQAFLTAQAAEAEARRDEQRAMGKGEGGSGDAGRDPEGPASERGTRAIADAVAAAVERDHNGKPSAAAKSNGKGEAEEGEDDSSSDEDDEGGDDPLTRCLEIDGEYYEMVNVENVVIPGTVDPLMLKRMREEDGMIPYRTYAELVGRDWFGLPIQALASERIDPLTDRPVRELEEERKELEQQQLALKAAGGSSSSSSGGPKKRPAASAASASAPADAARERKRRKRQTATAERVYSAADKAQRDGQPSSSL